MNGVARARLVNQQLVLLRFTTPVEVVRWFGAAALGHLPADDERVRMVVGNSLVTVDGRVRGTWKRALAPARVTVGFDFWTSISDADRRAVASAAERYDRFLGRPVRTDGHRRP